MEVLVKDSAIKPKIKEYMINVGTKKRLKVE